MKMKMRNVCIRRSLANISAIGLFFGGYLRVYFLAT